MCPSPNSLSPSPVPFTTALLDLPYGSKSSEVSEVVVVVVVVVVAMVISLKIRLPSPTASPNPRDCGTPPALGYTSSLVGVHRTENLRPWGSSGEPAFSANQRPAS